MKLTEALKAWAIKFFSLKADATDAEVKSAISGGLVDGKLSADDWIKASNEHAPKAPAGPTLDGKALVAQLVDERVTNAMRPVNETMSTMGKTLEALSSKLLGGQPAGAPAGVGTPPIPPPVTPSDMSKQLSAMLGEHGRTRENSEMADPAIVVKSVKDMFSTTDRPALRPVLSAFGEKNFGGGQQVKMAGVGLTEGSDLAKAVCGAYLKWACQPSLAKMADYPRWLKMTDLDKQLVLYALHEVQWSGSIKMSVDDENGDGYFVNRQKLTEGMRKDLLDDSTSGGTYAVPIFFDDMMVLTPLLYGELFPYVQVVNMTRGRQVDGSSMSNPSFTSGTAEGTAITPFDTTGFIANMDTTIYPVVSAVSIGKDFADDSPIGITENLMTKFGEALQKWLDEQIAIGDGTTEPQGFFNASGVNLLTSDNGVGGPATVGDYEALYFGIAKEFRRGNVAYVGNDETYRRARGIAVGPMDERRVFGMDHSSYKLLESPFRVSNAIANTKNACVNLSGYRMYRRLGMSINVQDAVGQTLALSNKKLIVVRGRFGGRLTLGGYAAISNTAEQ